jgi:hypothetical protein
MALNMAWIWEAVVVTLGSARLLLGIAEDLLNEEELFKLKLIIVQAPRKSDFERGKSVFHH